MAQKILVVFSHFCLGSQPEKQSQGKNDEAIYKDTFMKLKFQGSSFASQLKILPHFPSTSDEDSRFNYFLPGPGFFTSREFC